MVFCKVIKHFRNIFRMITMHITSFIFGNYHIFLPSKEEKQVYPALFHSFNKIRTNCY